MQRNAICPRLADNGDEGNHNGHAVCTVALVWERGGGASVRSVSAHRERGGKRQGCVREAPGVGVKVIPTSPYVAS